MNFAKSCKYTSSQVIYRKIFSLHREQQGFVGKKLEDLVDGPSIVFTEKPVWNEILIRDSTNWCKAIVGIDASQLYPSSMRQAMPTGL